MNHPITPSPELVRGWAQVNGEKDLERFWMRLATQAARWGADTELNECCHLLRQQGFDVIEDLRAARRPKPLGKAESALEALEHILRHSQTDHGANTIRQALQSLKELEALPND